MRATRLLPILLLAVGLVALGRVGGDELRVPLGGMSAITAWVEATQPVALAMAVLLLVAQGLCGYLLLAAVLQVLADALGYPWLTLLARRVVPFALRHALSGGAGLSLAAGSVLGVTDGVAGASPGPARVLVTTTDDSVPSTPTATMTLLTPTPPAVTPPPTSLSTPTPTATMVLLPPAPDGDSPASGGTGGSGGSGGTGASGGAAGPSVSLEPPPVPVADTDGGATGGTDSDGDGTGGDPDGTAPATSPSPPPTTVVVTGPEPGFPAGPATTTPPPAGAEPSAATVDDNEVWVVDAGDSFWSIAEDVVGAGDRTQAYWERLIAVNRGRLAVPDQPDLLFPGQRLTLPPPVPREG